MVVITEQLSPRAGCCCLDAKISLEIQEIQVPCESFHLSMKHEVLSKSLKI